MLTGRHSSQNLHFVSKFVSLQKVLYPSILLPSLPTITCHFSQHPFHFSQHTSPYHVNPSTSSHFTTSPPIMSSHPADTTPFFKAVQSRRTIHALEHSSPISDARIQEIVKETVKHVPSAFNSQTARLVVVLNKEHTKLWEIIIEVYKLMLPADKFEYAKGRLEGFRKAYGTVCRSASAPIDVSRKACYFGLCCGGVLTARSCPSGPFLRRHLRNPHESGEIQGLRRQVPSM